MSGITPGLCIRYYVDSETVASVDYTLVLAHATSFAQIEQTNLGPKDVPGTNTSKSDPWDNSLFAGTHDSGWYNSCLVAGLIAVDLFQ